MNIKYNETEKSIEIKDKLKTQYWLLNASAIINIINAIIFPLFVLNEKHLAWMGFIWILIGLFSVGLIIYQLLKKTASDKLKLSEIISLTEKEFLGRKKLSLKLKNGKSRDLMTFKKKSDFLEMKKLFQNMGIKTN